MEVLKCQTRPPERVVWVLGAENASSLYASASTAACFVLHHGFSKRGQGRGEGGGQRVPAPRFGLLAARVTERHRAGLGRGAAYGDQSIPLGTLTISLCGKHTVFRSACERLLPTGGDRQG